MKPLNISKKNKIRYFVKSIFSLFIIVYVFGSAPAQAQENGTQQLWFSTSETGDIATPLTEFNAPATNEEFTLYVIYHDDVPQVARVNFRVHWNDNVLEHVAPAALTTDGAVGVEEQPSETQLTGRPEGEIPQPSTTGIDDGDADTTHAVYLSLYNAFSSIYDTTPVSLIRMTFRWRADAPAGTTNTGLNISFGEGDISAPNQQVTNLTVNAPSVNAAPIADAGDNQNVDEGDTVTLNGSGSTDDDAIAAYAWSSETPGLGLTNAETATATFTAPEVDATVEIILTLTVTDTANLADSATVLITVNNVLPADSPFNDFVTVWDMTETNSDLIFPGYGQYTIDWGDGASETVGNPDGSSHPRHTYLNAGARTVTVSKTETQSGLTRFYLNNSSDKDLLIDVAQWGTSEWTIMERAFRGARNLAGFSATDNPNLSLVESMGGMFSNATTFNQDIGDWNVESVTNMRTLFRGVGAFNQDIGNWNVSRVTDMRSMFAFAARFDQNIGDWNVENVTNMESLFLNTDFNQNIGNWNVSGVTSMKAMFASAFFFNQDISSWNVESVTNMESMFSAAFAFNQDISSWNVEGVTNMNSMFERANAFDQNLGDWYVLLSPTSTSYNVFSSQNIATISAQNSILDNQVSAYALAGVDANQFTITNNQLSFIGDTAGSYNIDIEATGGDFGTNPPTISRQLIITTSPAVNTPPVANAGINQSVNEGAAVRLDGTGSTDNEPIALYGWTADPTITLTGANTNTAGFTAPEVEEAGLEIILTLTVTDTEGVADSATVLVRVNNVPDTEDPVANIAGDDTQTVNEGDTVRLDGSGSTDNIDIEFYAWSSETSGLDLTNADTATVTFTAPEVEEAGLEIILTLIVTDAAGLTDSATVLVTVNNVLPSSPNDFITVWNITAANSELTFPGYGEYTIDWGDGSPREAVNNPDGSNHPSHTYTTTGASSVTILKTDAQSGLTRFHLNNASDRDLLIDVAQWGRSEWTTMENAFSSASNLAGFSAADDPNLSQVESMQGMFLNASAFNQNIGSWNVENVTDMSAMFAGAAAFNQDIGSWNVSRVNNMFSMFFNAATFNQDISNWNVSQVTNMTTMFSGANAFNQNLGLWYVVLSPTSTSYDVSTSRDIATISAQNSFLDSQVSTYTLAGTDADKFTITGNQLRFTDDTAGTYNIDIEATDGAFGTSPPSTSHQLTITGNFPPIANAGSAQTVDEGATVRLDGRGSTDDDTIVAYAWTADTTLTLTNADTDTANFIAPEVEDAGLEIILTLTVTDTEGVADSAMVLITVNNVPDADTLDVDGNGLFDRMDGMMILRYSFSIRGDGLTRDQTTTLSETVEANIQNAISNPDLDIDASGFLSPEDFIMILRYMISSRGDALTSGQTATLPEIVENNIEALISTNP